MVVEVHYRKQGIPTVIPATDKMLCWLIGVHEDVTVQCKEKVDIMLSGDDFNVYLDNMPEMIDYDLENHCIWIYYDEREPNKSTIWQRLMDVLTVKIFDYSESILNVK